MDPVNVPDDFFDDFDEVQQQRNQQLLRPIHRPNFTDNSNSETRKKTLRGGFFAEKSENTRTIPKEKEVVLEDPLIIFPLDKNEKCIHCGSIELDNNLRRNFNIHICDNCREKFSDEYSLITKTSAKEDYLLTDEELRDTTLLPFIERPNPHKSTWSDMQLYLLKHVKEFAIKKWGSLSELEEEFNKREKQREMRKERKFKTKLDDLRRKTRSKNFKKNISKTHGHEHQFDHNDEDGKKCKLCGLRIEFEEF